ncbi:DUF421 domain-containing protein [Actinomarinicola tropica]|uniref:DUF421 domain-containing protein n=1 Tax=Actinomarinicola tropica TaxID=2789776 RepID=A0A5Q2RIW9_9ACTN|nr:YetF domain-containing protein [Actinomarinicola tropica]QGG95743.1 DUF421 domain-containing protein [Actinomarinicola tropica]
MDAVLRSIAIYAFLLVLFRIAGKRTLADITPFDFVLLLIIGEATQQGLLGDDFSVTNSFLVITTLLTIDIVLSLVKAYVPWLAKATEGVPVVLVADGQPIEERMKKARVDEQDILEAARLTQGLSHMSQVRYAVLERTGSISIIPVS